MILAPAEYINPRALEKLPEASYNALLSNLLSRLDRSPKASPNSWIDTFSNFALLAQSTLGGFCTRRLQISLHKLKWKDVMHILDAPLDEPTWIGITQDDFVFPIYIAPPVRFALLLLIQTNMAQKPTRNGAIRPISPMQLLAPPKEALAQRQQAYLKSCAHEAKLGFMPTIKDFRATGRWMLTRYYPLDVLHAQLGLVPTTSPPVSQLREIGPLTILRQLRPSRTAISSTQ